MIQPPISIFLSRSLGVALLVVTVLIVTGKMANPFGRYFEISAGSYRMLSDAYMDATPRYRSAVAHAIKTDGMISLSSYDSIFPLWVESVKIPYVMPMLDQDTKEVERARLLKIVECGNI